MYLRLLHHEETTSTVEALTLIDTIQDPTTRMR